MILGTVLCVLQAFAVMFVRYEEIGPWDSYIMLRAIGYLNVYSAAIMRINVESAKKAAGDEEYKAVLVHGYRKTAKRFAIQAFAFVLAGEMLKLVFVPVGVATIGNLLWNMLLYGVPLFLGILAVSHREWDAIPKEKERRKR